MHNMFLLFFFLIHGYGSVSGFVTDASNGEKLAYANVYLENTEYGGATNEKGYYIIQNIPSGDYRIMYSYIGYSLKTLHIQIQPDQNTTMNIELSPEVIEMEEINVSAERLRFEKEVEVSHVTFTPREIKSVPGLFEKDLIKTLQLMPGIVAMHDLSNKLYVRGGSPDENLVLLDGITVYNPSTHLFGLFSTFDPDAIGDAELYAGGFPAKFGDRLSSVLDVATKEGNSKKLAGNVSIGLVTSKLMFEGPIPKGSFLITGRRTYFDALVWAYAKITSDTISLPYYFYDGMAKINFNPTFNDRFTFAGLGGLDIITFETQTDTASKEKIDLEWGNRGTSLRWRRVFNPRFYGEIIGSWSNFLTHFRYQDYEDPTSNLHFYEEIIDYTMKSDFNYFSSETHTTDFGFDAKHLRIEYNLDVTEQRLVEQREHTNLYTVYLQDKWSVIPHILSLQAGLRVIYSTLGERKSVDPRLGLKYHITPNMAFNCSVGKYSQYLITINSQESYFSIFDFWRIIDTLHATPTSYHVIAGIERWLDDNTRFTVEPYYKHYYNLLLPSDNAMMFSAPSESLKAGEGYSTGIDVFFKKSFKDVFGWVSYSLCFTKRKIGNQYYSPRYDRRHNLNIVLGYTLPASIPVINKSVLNIRWYLATGLPYAEDLARYRYRHFYSRNDYWYTDYEWFVLNGPRDARRLPISHRLDMHLEKDFVLFGLNGSWYIDVINVYDKENILFHTWDYDEDPPEKTEYTLLPIPVPSIGVSFKF